MLILRRGVGEAFVIEIGGGIRVVVVDFRGFGREGFGKPTVGIGIEAPRGVRIMREEIRTEVPFEKEQE